MCYVTEHSSLEYLRDCHPRETAFGSDMAQALQNPDQAAFRATVQRFVESVVKALNASSAESGDAFLRMTHVTLDLGAVQTKGSFGKMSWRH